MTQKRNFPLESLFKLNTKVYLFIHYDDLVRLLNLTHLKVSFCKWLSTHKASRIGSDSNCTMLYTSVTKPQQDVITNFSVSV